MNSNDNTNVDLSTLTNTQLKQTSSNAVDIVFDADTVTFAMVKDVLAKYMSNNDTPFDLSDTAEDSLTLMKYINKLMSDVVVGGRLNRCIQRIKNQRATMSRSTQFGGNTLFDTQMPALNAATYNNFDLIAVSGKIWGFNNALSYTIREHNIASFDQLPGNTAEAYYVKNKAIAEAELIYKENSELSKLGTTFGRSENDFYSSWSLLISGLERLNQSIALPFTKLFLYGMQLNDLNNGQKGVSVMLNDKATGNLNMRCGIVKNIGVNKYYVPYSSDWTYDSAATPGNYRIDVQMVPLGWFASNNTRYDGYAPYTDGPIDRYIQGRSNVTIIPVMGGRVPILYILAHMYYPWCCWQGTQECSSYTTNVQDGKADMKDEDLVVLSNAACVEIGYPNVSTRGATPTRVYDSILLVDITDKNKVLENTILQTDVISVQMARPDLEPANLLPAVHDGLLRFLGSWNTALDYMLRIYRSTADMMNGLKQAVWLCTRYNRAGYVGNIFNNGVNIRTVYSETMNWAIYTDGDYKALTSNFHQLGDGTYIPTSDSDNSWWQREASGKLGHLLDCSPRFRIAVASGALQSISDVDSVGKLTAPNVALATLDNIFTDLIFTMKVHMHALHYLQSTLYNMSGLALYTVTRMDRYNSSAYDELRRYLVSWALGWELDNDVYYSVDIKKVLLSYNNTIYTFYTRDEIQLAPLLSVDKCILCLLGCDFPQQPQTIANIFNKLNLKSDIHYSFGLVGILTNKLSGIDLMRYIQKYFSFRFGAVARIKIDITKNVQLSWTSADAQFFGIKYVSPRIYKSTTNQAITTNEFMSITSLASRLSEDQFDTLMLHFTRGNQNARSFLPYVQTDTEWLYQRWEVTNDLRSECFLTLDGDTSDGIETHFNLSSTNVEVGYPVHYSRLPVLTNALSTMRSVFNKDKVKTNKF